MTGINYGLLARQLVELVKARGSLGKVPTVNPNSMLGIAIAQLNSVTSIADEKGNVPVDAVEALCKEVATVMDQPHVKEQVLNPVDEVATVIATRVKSSFGALTVYHGIVDETAKKIEACRQQAIAANPFLREDDAKTSVEYPVLSWTDGFSIPGLGENAVVDIVHKACNHEDGMPQLTVAQAYMQWFNALVAKLIKPIELPPETRQAIMKRLMDAAPDQDAAFVELELSLVLNPTSLSRYLAQLYSGMFSASGLALADTAELLINTHRKRAVLFNAIDSDGTYDVSPETMAKIRDNLTVYRHMSILFVYLLTYYRRNVFKNTILLPSAKLNQDNIDTFNGTEGITSSSLHNYVVVMLNKGPDSTMPFRGVTVEDVASTLETVKTRIEKTRIETASRRVYEFGQITRRVVAACLQGLVAQPPSGLAVRKETDYTKLSMILAQRVVSENLDPKTVIYDFLFKAFEVNPFAVILYETLGSEYTRILTTAKNVDENTLRMMEVSLVHTVILGYVKTLCCVK